MKTLNILGAGKVGKTLGYLFQQNNYFQVQDVLNKTLASAQAAVDFIGAGQAITGFTNLQPADLYLLAVADDQIALVCERLVAEHSIPKNAIVFHCSGALASTQLISAKQIGAYIASAHPLFSFSEPSFAITALKDAVCALEGDVAACQILSPAFTAIGMRVIEIEAKNKLLYHAALVMAGNYSVTLIAAAIAGLNKAGIANEDAIQMLQPMLMALMTRLFTAGPLAALTGPIVRGDYQLVAQELQALAVCDPPLAALYSELGSYTLELLKGEGGPLTSDAITLMAKALSLLPSTG